MKSVVKVFLVTLGCFGKSSCNNVGICESMPTYIFFRIDVESCSGCWSGTSTNEQFLTDVVTTLQSGRLSLGVYTDETQWYWLIPILLFNGRVGLRYVATGTVYLSSHFGTHTMTTTLPFLTFRLSVIIQPQRECSNHLN